jgi:hypothetical protein
MAEETIKADLFPVTAWIVMVTSYLMNSLQKLSRAIEIVKSLLMAEGAKNYQYIF